MSAAQPPSRGPAEHLEAGAHLQHRPPGPARRPAARAGSAGLAAAQEPRHGEHQREHHHRGDRDHHQGVLVAAEQAHGGEHDRAEDDQGEDVEQGLGDQRAEHDREAIAHAAEPARHDQRARGLAQAGRQRGRHEHADHRGPRSVAPARRAHRAARRAGSRARPRRAAASMRTSGRRRPAPTRGGGHQRAADGLDADALEGEDREPDARDQPRRRPAALRATRAARRRPLADGQLGLERGKPRGRGARPRARRG